MDVSRKYPHSVLQWEDWGPDQEGGTNREKEVGERGSGIPQIEHHLHQLFP